MDGHGAEDPLLPRTVESLKNEMKRRRQQSIKKPPLQQPGTVPTSESLADQKKLNIKKSVICLTAYIAAGVISFSLVGDQISGTKTSEILDAVYFCIVTMTTVGYGDLVPNSKLAKLLACSLLFAGMALVGLVLSNAADYILEKQEAVLVRATHMRERYSDAEILKEVEEYKTEYKFVAALSLLSLLIIVGTLLLHRVEDMSLFNAFYCVCATITTLGYGDTSFSTKSGRLFASFWILISTICLAQVFYYLAETYTERRQWSTIKWILSKKLTVSDLEAADLDHDSSVSAAEFIVYKLKEMEKISEEDIDMVMEQFKNLDIDQSGTLTISDILPTYQSGTPR